MNQGNETTPDHSPAMRADQQRDSRRMAEECLRSMFDTMPYIQRILNRIIRQQHGTRLTIPQLQALMIIARHPGMGVSAVAAHMGLTMSVTSKILDRLIRRCYLTRSVVPGDRRRAVLMVTAQGEAVMQACYHDVMTALLPLLLAVAPADIEQMAKSIGTMRRLIHHAHNLLNEAEYRYEERCHGTNTAVCADN